MPIAATTSEATCRGHIRKDFSGGYAALKLENNCNIKERFDDASIDPGTSLSCTHHHDAAHFGFLCRRIMSWPTAKRLSDSEKAGEQPAHGNSAEYSKVEVPSHPKPRSVPKARSFSQILKGKKNGGWWRVAAQQTRREISRLINKKTY